MRRLDGQDSPMRYTLPDDTQADRATPAGRQGWLHSRPLTSSTSPDLLDQLAGFWRRDDLRGIARGEDDRASVWMGGEPRR
jgi:hypothetical protein